MTWPEEVEQITAACLARNVDPCFVAAIRKAENGSPGREFGILLESAPDYTTQLAGCCATVRNNLARYVGNPCRREPSLSGRPPRLIYSDEFVEWFGKRYCPPSADPINVNWFGNVRAWYTRFRSEGLMLTGKA